MDRAKPHRVVLVDDHTLMRAGIEALLSAKEDLEVVGVASDGQEAMDFARANEPDLMLMDISMPRKSGTDAIGAIKRLSPNTRIIALTFHKDRSHVHAALKAGADGYVLKDDSTDELFNAINSVLAGRSYLSPAIAALVVSGFVSDIDSSNESVGWEVLTQREREIVKLIAEGNRTKDIAQILSLSPKTIEKHRSNLMRKLDLHGVSEVTTYAIQNGLVAG